MQQIRALVSSEFEQVNALIIEQLHSNVPLVENIGHYIVDAGGKRLRPLLVLARGWRPRQNQTRAHCARGDYRIHPHRNTAPRRCRRSYPACAAAARPPMQNGATRRAFWSATFCIRARFNCWLQLGNMPLMQLLADTTNTIAEGEVLQLTKAGDPNYR